MEYIYGLSDNRKAIIYNEGNNIVFGILGINRIVQWSVVARDYRLGLNSCSFKGSIYIVYVTTSNELVWQKVGGDGRLVVFSKVGETIDVYNIKTALIKDELYLLYQSKNSVTGAFEIRYILPKLEENSKTLISTDERIEDYEILHLRENLCFRCKIWGKEKTRIFIMNPEEIDDINIEEYILCKLDSVTKLEEQCKLSEENYKSAIKKLDKDWERKLKKTVEILETDYKKQYDDLSKMTMDIQEEGKKWRELYYKSVKKK